MTRPAPNANPRLADWAWLDRRYTVDQATVADIAAEAGADPSAVWLALRRHEIPLRGRVDVTDWRPILTADHLAARLDAGWSRRDIADEVGCHHTVVRDALARHGMEDVPAVEVRRLRRLYEHDGLSIAEVAARLGVHPKTAARRLRAAGIQMRPAGRRAGS